MKFDINKSPDFQAGQVLLINKPLYWTSFDVVNKIRIILKNDLKTGPIKVGHAGTLDPLATGLLILCTGRFTKRIEEFQAREKEYTGTLTLGATTPSYDKETPIDRTFDIDHISEELIKKTTGEFIGTITQIPPIFSAKKIDGERVYKKARRREKVVLKPIKVLITKFEIMKINPRVSLNDVVIRDIEFRIICSKGTYIRSLIHDFGKALSAGAYLSSLCRIRIGNFTLTDALAIDELKLRT
ncbi:MAG: tRNA pseudouridine(55) synthase TruB [Bacteroidota bacterium]